jgi:hypothetical protein
MTSGLDPHQIAHYRQCGYVAPVRVMSAEQALELRARLESFEQSQGRPLRGAQRHKTHLLFTWLNDLIRRDTILDAVASLYGDNLLCWTSNCFIKEAEDPSFVSWHQDSTYWGLSHPDVVTAWIALSPSTQGNGAMQVIPGTHLADQIPHRDTFSSNNLLTRGQEVAVDVDASQAISLELQPGEMSLHHVRIIHGSPPNRSRERRIGFAIRYIPTYVRQLQGNDSATLVRGVDTFNAFEHEPRPARDLDATMVELHRALTSRNAEILYAGTGIAGFDTDGQR